MTTLTVGAGQQYATIAAAVANTRDGDTVLVQAGTYVDDFFRVGNKITIKSVGGLAVLAAISEPGNGKGIIVADNDLTIEGFAFTGTRVGDGNGAGIRYDYGNLVVRDCVFWNNQNGILANASETGTILIEDSEFSHNGAGDGYTHNIYIGNVASVTIRDSYFHDSVVGHEIKSRARVTTITGNRIQDGPAGTGSYSIDIPDGGVALVEGNVIEKGPLAENYVAIHYGGENAAPPGSSLTVVNNLIVNDNANGILVNNATNGSPATLAGNQLWGFAADRIAMGPVTQTGNTVLAARPALDTSSLVPAVDPVPPPPPKPTVTIVPEGTVLQDWSSDGVVVRSGRVLTVGANGRFATLGSALTVAQDGDIIQVAAGTYLNDFGIVTKKVVIEGVGGIAHFMSSNVLGAPNGILVVRADATLRNLEFSGGHNWSGREAGIYVQAGKVTIVNSWLHGNDTGLLADDNPDTAIVVVNSEIGSNGNTDKGTNNVNIGAIGSFVIRNSSIHGAISAHNLGTRSYNTLIENNRIWDGVGVGTSFAVNLGQGGNAIVRNNLIERGPDAVNGNIVHVGGDGPSYSNSDVLIAGNSIVTRLQNEDHPYTWFIFVDKNAGPVPKTTVRNNVFFGGVRGSEPIRGIEGAALISPLGAAPVLDTSAPWSASSAPPLFVGETPGPNMLTLRLAERQGQVHTQFTVAVDGVSIGSGLVTADYDAGAWQTFTFTGWWGAGQHAVALTTTNLDAGPYTYGFFVDQVSLDGASVFPAAGFTHSATLTTTLSGTTKLPDFDAAYYLAHNPDVRASGVDPLQHYLTVGWRQGRDPNALFSVSYYLSHNPDVAASGAEPLQHFEQTGWAQGRDPSSLFSVQRYLAANPSVAAANLEPLRHYLEAGQAQGRPSTLDPNKLVDSAWYYAQHPDVAAAGIDAATHYHTVGWTLRYDPNPWFDTTWYQLQNPQVASQHLDPLEHFANEGWRTGRDPSPYFSLARYDAAHPGSAGIDPLVAFLSSAEGTATPAANSYSTPEAALFDPQYYGMNNPDVLAYRFDPLTHFETLGWREQRNPSALFDTAYYLVHNPDVAAAGIDPLQHFAEIGWKQGRDPSAAFSTSAYLAANPDVAASGIDPLQHYIQTGRAEGRAIQTAAPATDPLVDSAWYYAQHPDVAAAGIDAATHYHTVGWTLRYDPNPWFDTTWYQLQNPTVASRHIDPLLHFETEGWRDGRDPSPYFSLARYQAAHPGSTSTDPLISFLAGTEDAPVAGVNRYSNPEAALFDPQYYGMNNPDVLAYRFDPLTHFETLGWREQRNPSALFDTAYYLVHNPDVAAAGIDPLQHFAEIGWKQGRDPSAAFSTSAYLAANPDVAASGIDPLQHYIQTGRAEGRAIQTAAPAADPLVDSAWYYAQHPDVAAAGIDAATHYHTVGWTLRYDPNPWFDTTWYQLQNPTVASRHIDPLLHFETEGWRDGRDPSPYFSLARYQAAHPGSTSTDPLISFLAGTEDAPVAGVNRYSNPEAALFDPQYYGMNNPDVLAYRFDPLTHFETLGWREQRNPSALFDTAYYLVHNPDVAAAGIDPLQHFAEIGWKQGRDPSAAFSTSAYLAANPDVAASGIDPLQHYIQTGRAEGRAIQTAAPAADPLVDSAWYYAQHPDVAAAGIDAATHYHTVGWTLRYDPNPWFDTTWYQLQNPTVASRHIDPLLHFETEGWRDGRDPSPYFSLARYQAAHPETAGADPLISFLAGTEATPTATPNPYSTPEAALFDAAYYSAHNPDVAAHRFDPLTHYETLGWREGRDPSAAFSTNKYLAAYGDVRAAVIDPLGHYASVGISEGRTAFSV